MARKADNGVEHNQPLDTEVEAEIREFVRRDVVTNRERHPENESEMVANSINSVLQGATTTSVQEIDKLITETAVKRGVNLPFSIAGAGRPRRAARAARFYKRAPIMQGAC